MRTRRHFLLGTAALISPFLIGPRAASACEFVTPSSYSPPSGTPGDASLYGHTSSPEGIDGLDPVFRDQVAGLIAAANREFGGSMVIYSGYRSIERQRQLYEAALARYGSEREARRWVAPPGASMHNFGLAVDLRHNGGRIEYGQPISNWMTANLARFGLVRPLSNEGWHVEPIGGRERRNQMVAGARGSGPLPAPPPGQDGVPNYGTMSPGSSSCQEILRDLPMVGLMPWGVGGDISAD
ncbi:D-alanyl-D-alanine carboxypeptidase-like protein [Gemmobacter caeni]|jgi:hypothetical protein|uniref:D-alanyl-D-alanine carboxypeptidase-like protein n=1 Tax=Gemmobacter caeni TaxID=589035 RepID=A0A2T6B8U6_9RHOB|nr:D-alanyl-D-alanine carboxypeptidase family protein [Gemmobacter caeni]PTX52484.1 D-alanyl-D-alanine carboxypeptidase-like protein [Gemmobacter caeni]TWJ02845.1 D-alanyl-D-alanine carboxypeptidase-like protein [Gemmobacter caeni]